MIKWLCLLFIIIVQLILLFGIPLKMKPSMFKIRRFNANNTESKEGPHSLTPKEREESELYQATQTCQENMGKLMTMF